MKFFVGDFETTVPKEGEEKDFKTEVWLYGFTSIEKIDRSLFHVGFSIEEFLSDFLSEVVKGGVKENLIFFP